MVHGCGDCEDDVCDCEERGCEPYIAFAVARFVAKEYEGGHEHRDGCYDCGWVLDYDSVCECPCCEQGCDDEGGCGPEGGCFEDDEVDCKV